MCCIEVRASASFGWRNLLMGGFICLMSACATTTKAPEAQSKEVQTTTPSMRAAAPPVKGSAGLPGPRSRNWDQFRQLAAERIVSLNSSMTYSEVPPDILLAVPVLMVEFNRDGSIRRIDVLRYPRQAFDTVDLAVAAVKRAAPFGDMSHLPQPWHYTESFLFNDARKFKPRTLDR